MGTGGGEFAPATELTTCSLVHEVAVDDLNGDSNLDIVTSCPGDGVVAVRLGNGDGTFSASVRYSVGSRPNSVAIADLNNDNISDLVAANYFGSSIAVLLGNGDGTFRAALSYGVDAGPHTVRAGDVNGDGALDLVTANDLSGTISVLIGNGDGTFRAQQVYAVRPGPKSVALGDIDGDGSMDIVVANSWGNYEAATPVPTDIGVLRGNGDGSFAAAEFYPIDLTPFSIAIADFNGDGRADVATALWHSNNVGVFLNVAQRVGPFAGDIAHERATGTSGLVVSLRHG